MNFLLVALVSATYILFLMLMIAQTTRISSVWKRWVFFVAFALLSVLGQLIIRGFRLWRMEYVENYFQGYFTPYVIWCCCVCLMFAYLMVIGFRQRDGQAVARSWRRRWLLLVTVLLGCVTTFVYLLVDFSVVQELRQLDDHAAAELRTLVGPPVPPEQNAYPIHAEVAALQLKEKAQKVVKAWNEEGPQAEENTPNPAMVAALAAEIAPQAEKLRQAGKLPYYQFPHDFSDIGTEYWGAGAFGAVESNVLLIFDARWKAKQGDLHTAVADVAALQQMALHVDQECDEYAKSFATIIYGRAISEVSYLLQHHSLSEKDLDQLLLFKKHSHLAGMEKTGKVTKWLSVRMITDVYQRNPLPPNGEAISSITPLRFASLQRVLMARQDLENYQAEMDAYIQLTSPPSPLLKDYWKQRNARGFLAKVQYVSIPLDANYRMNLRSEALSRVAQLGIAAYRYALRHGDFPASLETLAQFDPSLQTMDPFNNQPLQMVRQEDKLTIYSVGPDGVDDGGKDYFEENGKLLGDTIFTIGRPEQDSP